MVRLTLIVLGALTVMGVIWMTGSDDGGTPVRPGEDGGGRSEPSEGPTVEPPAKEPHSRVSELLDSRSRNSAELSKALAALAADEDGAREILDALAHRTADSERSLLLMHLVRGGTRTGLDGVRKAATGEGRSEDRIPAIYALSAGDVSDLGLIATVLEKTDDEDLYRASAFALAMRGDDPSLHYLDLALYRAETAKSRRILYESLAWGPNGVEVEFERMLREVAPGLQGRERPAVTKFASRIAAERDPSAVPAAARALAGMDVPEAQQGITELWRNADEEAAYEVMRMVVEDLRVETPGASQTFVTVLSESEPEKLQRYRQTVISRMRHIGDPETLPALRDWRESVQDPEVRATIDATIERLSRGEQPPR